MVFALQCLFIFKNQGLCKYVISLITYCMFDLYLVIWKVVRATPFLVCKISQSCSFCQYSCLLVLLNLQFFLLSTVCLSGTQDWILHIYFWNDMNYLGLLTWFEFLFLEWYELFRTLDMVFLYWYNNSSSESCNMTWCSTFDTKTHNICFFVLFLASGFGRCKAWWCKLAWSNPMTQAFCTYCALFYLIVPSQVQYVYWKCSISVDCAQIPIVHMIADGPWTDRSFSFV